jgi:hypothetical protein
MRWLPTGSNLSKYQSTTCSLLDLSSLAISTSVIVPMSYNLSRWAGCLYRQTADSWNVLDTLGNVIVCNHLAATRRFHHVPEPSMGFREVLQGSMRFYEALWGSMGFHEVPWGSAEFCKVSWGSTGFCEVPWGSIEFYDVPWHSIRFYEVPWGSMMFLWTEVYPLRPTEV